MYAGLIISVYLCIFSCSIIYGKYIIVLTKIMLSSLGDQQKFAKTIYYIWKSTYLIAT